MGGTLSKNRYVVASYRITSCKDLRMKKKSCSAVVGGKYIVYKSSVSGEGVQSLNGTKEKTLLCFVRISTDVSDKGVHRC